MKPFGLLGLACALLLGACGQGTARVSPSASAQEKTDAVGNVIFDKFKDLGTAHCEAGHQLVTCATDDYLYEARIDDDGTLHVQQIGSTASLQP